MKIPLFNKTGEPDTSVDPVCNMTVIVSRPAGGTFQYKKQTYYFCGPGCRVAFSKEPEAYLSGQKTIDM